MTNQRGLPEDAESHVISFPDPIQVNAGEILTVVYTVGFGPEYQDELVCCLESVTVTPKSDLVGPDFDYLNGL